MWENSSVVFRGAGQDVLMFGDCCWASKLARRVTLHPVEFQNKIQLGQTLSDSVKRLLLIRSKNENFNSNINITTTDIRRRSSL